jgi:GNAT superfamily N-acetyltransferase
VIESAQQHEWRVRPAQPGDAASIVQLLNEVYGDWGDLDYWRWKYQQSPAPFQLPSAVADLNGRVIGHFGIVPVDAVLNGETVPGAQTVDAAVLPAYRRCGIHTALGRYVLDHAAHAGITLVYAFPGIFSLAVDQRLGYCSVASMPEMMRVVQSRRALALALRLLPGDLHALWSVYRTPQGMSWSSDSLRRVVRLRRSLLLLASWCSDSAIARPGRLQPARMNDFELRPVTEFDVRFDALWVQVCCGTRLGLCKDASYLNWRYRLNPRASYEIMAAEQQGQVLGFLVMRHTGLQSHLTELLALPDHTDVVSALLATAVRLAQRAGSLILTAWMPVEHPYHINLRQAGFISQRRLHWLAERWPTLARQLYQVIIYARHLPLDQQAQLVSLASRWSLTMGDSDLI